MTNDMDGLNQVLELLNAALSCPHLATQASPCNGGNRPPQATRGQWIEAVQHETHLQEHSVNGRWVKGGLGLPLSDDSEDELTFYATSPALL